jgi:hypothetical protein
MLRCMRLLRLRLTQHCLFWSGELFAERLGPSRRTTRPDRRLHGGSFVRGSATAPGIDGSALAKKGVVVVVLQFR